MMNSLSSFNLGSPPVAGAADFSADVASGEQCPLKAEGEASVESSFARLLARGGMPTMRASARGEKTFSEDLGFAGQAPESEDNLTSTDLQSLALGMINQGAVIKTIEPQKMMLISEPSVQSMTSAGRSSPMVEQILQKLGQILDNETDYRQGALKEFLLRMDSEVGVSPEKLLNAFLKLDTKALSGPPEDARESLINALQLTSKQDRARASQLYSELVGKTEPSSLNEEKAIVAAATAIDGIQARSQALKQLRRAGEDLQSVLENKLVPHLGMPAKADFSRELVAPMAQNQRRRELMEAALVGGMAGVALAAAELAPESVKSLKALKSEALRPAMDSVAPDVLQPGATIENLVTRLEALPSFAENSNPGFDQRKESSGGAKAAGRGETVRIKSDSKGAGADSFLLAGLGAGAVSTEPLNVASAPPLFGPLKPEVATPQMMDRLVSRAELLVGQGGGEMKVQLQPDELGSVHLRVAVKGDRVAIELQTDNEMAKKILEKHVGDLREQLTSSDLKVESLKIDMGRDPMSGRLGHAATDSSRDQSREAARDFMQQFRQDREQFRNAFGESLGSFRQPSRPRAEILPEAVSGVRKASAPASSAIGSMRSGRGARLNLVA